MKSWESLLVLLLTLSAAAGVRAAQPGESLLANPKPSIPPNFGFWVGGAVLVKDAKPDSPATYEWTKIEGVLGAKINSRSQLVNASFGAYCKAERLKTVPVGTLVRVSVEVRGNLRQQDAKGGQTAHMDIEVAGASGKGDLIVLSPKREGNRNLPVLGEFGWTTLEAVFPFPENTELLRVQCLLNNALGDIEWKSLQVALAPPDAKTNVVVKARYETTAEMRAEALAKYDANWAKFEKELGVPAADKIYKPKPALSGPHPRYLFPGASLAELKRRIKLPEYARYRDDLFKQATEFANNPPIKPPSMDVEDPLRGYGDRFAWMALAYLLSDDPAQKKLYLDAVVRDVNELSTWGPPPKDLPNSQFIFGFAAVYDWLYDVLPADTKAKCRKYIFEMAQWMRQPENKSAWQWRGGPAPEWMANHKWWNYSALAVAGVVLWGEEPEAKTWLDEAMRVFWVVRKTFPEDGVPVEGFMYGSYGNRPYFDFAVMTDQLTDCAIPFLDAPDVRNMGVSRLHSALPNNAGFFTFADSHPRAFLGSEAYRLVAARFKDGQAQLLADLMEAGTPAPKVEGDDSLPAYAPPTMPAATGEAIVRQFNEFTKVGDIPEGKPRNGSLGPVSAGWTAPGSEITTKFAVPADGVYRLLVKYASGGRAVRTLLIDGQPPFREAVDVVFLSTGGWSNLKNEFAFVELPWLIALTKGEHTLVLRCDQGAGFSLDWLALLPANVKKADVVAKLGDTDAKVEPIPEQTIVANWRNLFWFDASVPAAKSALLPLYRDNTDFGLYTARSSWTDPKATWFGFKCGPVSGMTALSNFGPALISGHFDPDPGTFLFYAGSRPVVPGSNYEHLKLTASHPLVLVESKRKGQIGKPIGQFGEAGTWYGGRPQFFRSQPTVLAVEHKPAYHTYLCELEGVYVSREEKDFILKSYRRSLTYFTNGVVVIADKLEAPVPRNFHFRIPTAAKDMTVTGRDFSFNIGRTPGRIVDFTKLDCERTVTNEVVVSWPNLEADPAPRQVAVIRAAEQTNVVFAFALGMNGAEKNFKIEADDQKIVIRGAPGGDVTLGWKPELQPIPLVKTP
jgi:hypothetical protein